MARRLLAVLGCGLVSAIGFVPGAAAASVLPMAVGGGSASVGPVHISRGLADLGGDETEFLTIDQVSMSGLLQFGGTSFLGHLRIGTLTGSGFWPETPHGGCTDGDCTVLYQENAMNGGLYRISNAPVPLNGENGKGDRITGTCRGNVYDESLNNTIGVGSPTLETNCTASLNGTISRSFVLTIQAFGESASHANRGVFVAHSLGGDAISNTLFTITSLLNVG